MYKRIESFQLENVFEIKGSRGSENPEFPRLHFENVFKNIKGSRGFMICRELENVFKSITDSWRSEFQGFFWTGRLESENVFKHIKSSRGFEFQGFSEPVA